VHVFRDEAYNRTGFTLASARPDAVRRAARLHRRACWHARARVVAPPQARHRGDARARYPFTARSQLHAGVLALSRLALDKARARARSAQRASTTAASPF
jgi:hypothetical protein